MNSENTAMSEVVLSPDARTNSRRSRSRSKASASPHADEESHVHLDAAPSCWLGSNGTEPKPDPFCWICHLPVNLDRNRTLAAPGSASDGSSESSPDVAVAQCAHCSRSYHPHCWIPITDISCVECQAVEAEARDSDSVFRRVGDKKIQQFYLYMLRFVEDKLVKDQDGPFARNPSAAYQTDQEQVISPAAMLKLKQCVVEGRYTTYAQFLADLRGLIHRSLVVHGVDSGYTRIAVFIAETCKQLCNFMDWCVYCFECCLPASGETLEEAITRAMGEPCALRHAVVSVSLPHRLWPAVVYKFDGHYAFVRFFGTLEFGRVSQDSVWMLNEDFELEGPNEPKKEQYELYVTALRQCRQLISKLLKLPDINVEFFPQDTPFDGRAYFSSAPVSTIAKRISRETKTRNRGRKRNFPESSPDTSVEPVKPKKRRRSKKVNSEPENGAAAASGTASAAVSAEETLSNLHSETDEPLDETTPPDVVPHSRRTSLLLSLDLPQLAELLAPNPGFAVQLPPIENEPATADDLYWNQLRNRSNVPLQLSASAPSENAYGLGIYGGNRSVLSGLISPNPTVRPWDNYSLYDSDQYSFNSSFLANSRDFSVLENDGDVVANNVEQQLQSFFADLGRVRDIRRIEMDQIRASVQNVHTDYVRRFMETQDSIEQVYLQQIMDNQRILENALGRFQTLFTTYRATNEAFLHSAVFESGRKQGVQDRSECVLATKRAFWCCVCLRRAQYLCCGVSLYCSEECQAQHLPQHQAHCRRLLPPAAVEDTFVQTPFGVLTLCRSLPAVEIPLTATSVETVNAVSVQVSRNGDPESQHPGVSETHTTHEEAQNEDAGVVVQGSSG